MKKSLEWLKAAKEHFDEAIEADNLALARDIVADVFEAGFGDDARDMALQLKDIV